MESTAVRIAICEDRAEDMGNLMDILYVSADQNKISAKPQISTFPSGESFIEEFKEGDYDLIFLDIFMKDMTGMDTAKLIRRIDSDCAIVFTTTSKDFAIEGYKVDALDYIIKPAKDEEIIQLITKYLDSKKEKEGPFITVIADYRKVDVTLSKIVYIEVIDKYCIFHTTERDIKSRMSMNELVDKLSRPFLRCHRSYMVNLDYVKDITEDFIMKNGDVVYIRKNDYAHIKEEYLKYLMR